MHKHCSTGNCYNGLQRSEEEIMSDKKLTPQERYDKNNTKRVQMKLNLKLDKDVLDWLDKQDSMQGAIKQLIRDQIKRES